MTPVLDPVRTGTDTVCTTDTSVDTPWPRPRAVPADPDAAKLETLGRLLTAVAHDVNNVLAVVCGNAELLADALPPGSVARESADVIRAAAEHATGLARRLLAFARPADRCPVAVDLVELLAGLDPLIRAVAGAGVRVTVAADRRFAPVTADPTDIEQVVLNLVANARDAMPDGGDLVVRVGATGRFALLAVTDTGVGMDEATAALAFEPFFTTKGPAGTGVGLATVRGVVDRLGGEIEVESRLGLGTEFRIYLPAVAPADPELGEGGRDTDAVEGGWIPTGTVLLVDDHDGARSAAKAILEAAGYDVIEAATGDGAARLARAVPTAIDVLVTDVVLPGLGGRKLAAKLRAERPGLGVVYVSGYPSAADDAGAAFVGKPFRRGELVAAVRQAMGAAVHG